MIELIKAIDCLLAELQGVVGTEVVRDREAGAGLIGDDNGLIHTEYGVVHIKYRALYVHNEDTVLPADAFATAGLVHLANRNGAIDFTLSYMTHIILSQW